MRKNLLTVALLAAGLTAQAQILTYVGDGAIVSVSDGSLVYSGGGIRTVGNGVISNSGNIMMNTGNFETVNADNSPKTDGGNFILRMNDRSGYTSYGQFYITGSAQANLTGIVSKEYLAAAQGDYQQMALPFYQKTLSTLNTNPTELGTNALTQQRWSQTEILDWDNRNVKSDHLPLWGHTTMLNPTNNNSGVATTTKPNSYYMVGSKNWKANSGKTANKRPDATAAGSYNIYTIEGVPVAEGISETLQNAGLGYDYGGGWALNVYRERYYTYLADPWIQAQGLSWAGNYGKNMYLFGNPYFTNLDLSQIVGNDGGATITDGNNITNLIGIRYETTNVKWNSTDGTAPNSTTVYTTFTAGVPIGDAIPAIKPMGVFTLKLQDNSAQTLNFDTLRRFKNTNRTGGVNYDVTAAKSAANTAKGSGAAYVKQIGLIALDATGTELGRTYYAVYPDAVTGQSDMNKTQVTASNANVIGTFEEAKTGGIDSSLENTYWLYINVANDVDFKGKNIPVRIYSNEVKSIKVELKEDGVEVRDNAGLAGEQFYVAAKEGETSSAVKNGQIIPVTGTNLAVSYGSGSGFLAANNVAKPSETVVVYDDSRSKYVVIFDKAWKKADVTVYDMSGKLVSSEKAVNTQNNHALNLPAVNGVYVITAVSESGQKFVQKIKK